MGYGLSFMVQREAANELSMRFMVLWRNSHQWQSLAMLGSSVPCWGAQLHVTSAFMAALVTGAAAVGSLWWAMVITTNDPLLADHGIAQQCRSQPPCLHSQQHLWCPTSTASGKRPWH